MNFCPQLLLIALHKALPIMSLCCYAQSLESPRTPEDSSRVELKSQLVNLLLDRVHTICEEDIQTLNNAVEQWTQLDKTKANTQVWAE